MSAYGTKRTCNYCPAMSAFGGKANIVWTERDVRTSAFLSPPLCFHVGERRVSAGTKKLPAPSGGKAEVLVRHLISHLGRERTSTSCATLPKATSRDLRCAIV
jgi:hypothetical protein